MTTSMFTSMQHNFSCDTCSAHWARGASNGAPQRTDAAARSADAAATGGSRFGDVWQATAEKPYTELPRHHVTLRSFFKGLTFALGRDARAILNDQRDVRPPYQKLIRANGIGLRGEWHITEDTPYTGYLRRGSRGLVIARASVGLTATTRGAYRAFGMAIKLFPTIDPDDRAAYRTANLFVIDDNAGTLTPHYLDAEMASKARLSFHSGTLRTLHLLGAITIAQRLADSFSTERQLYPASELGEPPTATIRTPRFLMVRGSAGQPRVSAVDFRDELRVARYPGSLLRFDLAVRETETESWTRIGEMTFVEDACSAGCDHRLHFPHPLWR
ncbi:hypothetical protein [Sorangium sp. So ce1182]|uniref:hypothetical protein n=1 Tax=Sorangium sp. So ce1182 TaxID=3133334 RepID=UPI003F6409A3